MMSSATTNPMQQAGLESADISQMSGGPQPLPNGMGAEAPEVPQMSPQEQSLREMLESTNIAEKLDKEKLDKIGMDAKKGFDADKQSRADWEACLDEWTKLAIQYREDKTWPWPNASNVKYPC